MRLVSFLCVFLFSTYIPHKAYGLTDYQFNRITIANGLSSSEIKCIFKDSNGFMWFGTPSGLNRYDGYQIQHINQDLSKLTGPANNDIERIQESADGMLWMRTAFGYTVYNIRQERFEYDIVPLVRNQIGIDTFQRLIIDKAQNYWFITDNDIRFRNPADKTFTIIPQGGANELSPGVIVDIARGENRYWFLYASGLLECIDAQTLKVIGRFTGLQDNIPGAEINTLRMFISSTGEVWIYAINTNIGVASFDLLSKEWEIYASSYPPSHRLHIPTNIVFALAEDSKGNLWIGSDHGGVTLINKKTGLKENIRHNGQDPRSLPENAVKSLYCDDLGIVWAGTYKQGVGYYYEGMFKFRQEGQQSHIPYSDINCFEEDPKGNLWIGTNGGGLIYYDRKLDKYTQYTHKPGDTGTPSGNVIVSMTYDKAGKLWIGYYLDGLDCFDGQRFTNYQQNLSNPEGMTDNNFWVLTLDKSGGIWAGTLNGGTLLIDPATGKRTKQLESGGSVSAIIQKKSGDILMGSQSGLFIYDKTSNSMIAYEPEALQEAQLIRYDISCLHEDNRGLIWIGTRNGLFVFNPYSGQHQLFNTSNGLVANLIQNIQEDEGHNIWVSTNLGLSMLSVYTRIEEAGYFYHINNYDPTDGLVARQFNYSAGFVTTKGELVFGSIAGFNLFHPSEVIRSAGNPRVVLTGLQIYNNTILPGQRYNGRHILQESIAQTQEIELSYKDKYFTLSFAAQDYTNGGRSRYFYKLEGFNNQWLEADRESRKVTFTNLNPGHYVFHLKSISNDLNSGEYPITLRITVLPPFWQTIWAWMVYVLILIGSLLYYWRYTARKAEKKLMYARERMQAVQQHQIHEMKLRFFTNISHEFRTPLTLILTPLEGLLKKTQDPDDKVTLSIIHRNAQQLLQLVNQLLDFRKLDVRGHSLNKGFNDLAELIRGQSDLFTELLASKQIDLTIETIPEHLYTNIDADKIAKVLVNLLFNAQKFTPAGGKIVLRMEADKNEKKVRITVTDNGIGIPEESLEKIFERFYQVKQTDEINRQEGGSGIGLHLAKEFVTLHGGDMWAENVPEGGSRFVVVLPIEEASTSPSAALQPVDTIDTQQAAITTIAARNIDDILSLTNPPKPDERPKLLLVDDVEDFRLYLSGRLKDQYTILEASNGIDGLELALQEIPDMILTDVMMARMDGIEMSKRIKADIRTSHIPIILLTAKSGEESKLEGLAAGADDYITKPFNMDILMVKIHNLVERVRMHQQVFKEQIRIEPSKITVNSIDEKLIRKAIDYTESHMSNPDLSVEELSREVGMSRATLYKKILSLTGRTPIEFIRVIRLKRAAQLLKESQLTVSEIAYMVGFNNPKYFRKYFKDEFGILPSQYGEKDE